MLLETVAGLLEEAKKPGAEPAQGPWWTPDTPYEEYRDWEKLVNRDWTIEQFISNTTHTLVRQETPAVQWKFLDPNLPIIRVTVHANQDLPLDTAESRSAPLMQRATSYSVSFVMSVQNRWTSFDDQDHWIIRFKDSFDHYPAPPWRLDEELPYPDYWDDTDYMQHRIIGPVVLTVGHSEVLEPGTYSAEPRIPEWEAPGHVLTDEQVPTETRGYVSGRGTVYSGIDRPEDPAFWQWPMYNSANAGFPLPGHVLTTPQTGPGTEVWREEGMDGYDW